MKLIQNMKVSAGLIEENELSKGPDGLNIVCAYYGAIEYSTDPNVNILDIAFGPVLDVKIPLMCLIENSHIIHRGTYIIGS